MKQQIPMVHGLLGSYIDYVKLIEQQANGKLENYSSDEKSNQEKSKQLIKQQRLNRIRRGGRK